MTLTEFLKARVAEDEAEIGRWQAAMEADETAARGVPSWVIMAGGLKVPRHVLAECAAKWQILAAYDATAETDTRQAGVGRAALAHVLRCLAAVYADHPDYDPEWAPDA